MNSSQLKLVAESGNKKCSMCKEIKLISEFCKSSVSKDGLCPECRGCHSERNKIHRQRYLERYRHQKRVYSQRPEVKLRAREKAWVNYGIVNADGSPFKIHDYEVLFAQQNGKCAVCETTDTGSKRNKHLYVDHDHKTGFVRWLLCNFCNQIFSHSKDRPEILEKAARMLREKQ